MRTGIRTGKTHNLRDTTLIKLGGRAAADRESLAALIDDITLLVQESRPVVLVHGGGAEVSALSEKLGMKAVFENGIRMTSPDEMDVVDMVLSGRVNSYLVRSLCSRGIAAVGMRGSDASSLIGMAITDPEGNPSHTGKPARTNPALLTTLLNSGYVPVVSPTAMDEQGRALNINADESALALAEALSVDTLLFLSDVPGVLDMRERPDATRIPRITPADADRLIHDGVVTGGMIPKVESALHALGSGVRRVVIGRYEQKGDLQALMQGQAGTAIMQAEQDGGHDE